VLLASPYGYGAGMQLNSLADSLAPQRYPVTVVSKYIHRGSKSTSRHLVLEPWGPVTARSDITVPADMYSSTQPGDTVCVLLHPGALGVEWYEITACAD